MKSASLFGRMLAGVAIATLVWPPALAFGGEIDRGKVEPAVLPAADPPVRPGTSRNIEHRGRVNVADLADSSAEAGPGTSSAVPNPLAPAELGDVQAAPATALATTNSSDPPTLTKIGVTVGDAMTPNPVVAVGPDHVIRSDDGVMRLTNRTGVAARVISYADFFADGMPPNPTHKQGQVYFDPVHGRWIALDVSDLCSSFNAQYFGSLNFAVSETADPTLNWDLYAYASEGIYLFDPGFGTSADKLVLTSRFHAMGANCASSGTDAWDATVIGWSDLLDGGDLDASYFLFPQTATLRPDKVTPAVRGDADSDALDVVGQIHRFATGVEEMWHFRIAGPGRSAAISATNLTAAEVVPPFRDTTSIPQPTGGFNPASGLTSLVAHDSRLVGAMSEACTPAADSMARNCVRIVDLETSTPTATRRQDFYLAQNGKQTFSPGAAFSQSGELVITFQRATASQGPTAYVVRQAPGDPLGTTSAPRTLATPTAGYENLNGAERMGLAPDPLVADAVWVINQAGGTADPEPSTYRLQVAQASTAVGATYVPIAPLRVLDTRTTPGDIEDFFWSGQPKAIDVAGVGTIPANAVAITGNLTVVMQTTAGYVSVGPDVAPNPTSSTINFPSNEERANNVTVPLNSDGDIEAVFKGIGQSATGLILDVTGYFLADDSGSTYEPLTSARVLDTRTGTGLSGRFLVNSPRTFQVTGLGGVPAGASAVTGNLTVVGQSRRGYVSLTPTPQANPTTSTINFPLGDTRANGVTVPLSGTGTLSAVFKASGGSTDLIFDVTGYYLDGTSGLRFYPLNPGRIMDTRFNTNQLFGQFSSSVPRTLVTGGHFGVPGNALAVTGNLTVVGQTKAGYVSITKDPTANPTVSNLNFPAGDVRANGVTVPLNAASDMAIVYKATSGAKTHLILDLTGYFR